MAFSEDREILLGLLDDELCVAAEPGSDLFSRVIAGACTRIPVLCRSEPATRLLRLIECGAWTDAAIAVVALELADWSMRRLSYENGEWCCSLSRQPNVPADLDDSADASHVSRPLAILRAFLLARRMSGGASRPATVPQVAPSIALPICCDNFA